MSMKNVQASERLYSPLGMEFCSAELEIAGQKLRPDDTKGYIEFRISHPWPVVTAYQTCMHPATVANSFASMHHQVFNLDHRMRAYDKSKERDEIPRDFILGSIVGVEFPQAPYGGWKMQGENPPCIRAAAVIHKCAEKVPQILGEHLSGKHKWTVSMEVDYSVLSSGFVVMKRGEAKGVQAKLLDEVTPEEFTALGLGYVTMEQAPDELLEQYDFDKRRMKPNAQWGKLPLALMKGGVGGQVHFRGVGLVRFGAEREAEVASVLAADGEGEALEELRKYFERVAELAHVVGEKLHASNSAK